MADLPEFLAFSTYPLYCADHTVSRDGKCAEKNERKSGDDCKAIRTECFKQVEPAYCCTNQSESDCNNGSGNRDTKPVKAPPLASLAAVCFWMELVHVDPG